MDSATRHYLVDLGSSRKGAWANQISVQYEEYENEVNPIISVFVSTTYI